MMTCAVYIENILHNLYSAVIKEWRHSGTSYPRFTWNMAIKMEREIKEIGVDLFGQYQLFVNALMHAVHACNLMKNHSRVLRNFLPNSHHNSLPYSFLVVGKSLLW